jgi:hypothetical protein
MVRRQVWWEATTTKRGGVCLHLVACLPFPWLLLLSSCLLMLLGRACTDTTRWTGYTYGCHGDQVDTIRSLESLALAGQELHQRTAVLEARRCGSQRTSATVSGPVPSWQQVVVWSGQISALKWTNFHPKVPTSHAKLANLTPHCAPFVPQWERITCLRWTESRRRRAGEYHAEM